MSTSPPGCSAKLSASFVASPRRPARAVAAVRHALLGASPHPGNHAHLPIRVRRCAIEASRRWPPGWPLETSHFSEVASRARAPCPYRAVQRSGRRARTRGRASTMARANRARQDPARRPRLLPRMPPSLVCGCLALHAQRCTRRVRSERKSCQSAPQSAARSAGRSRPAFCADRANTRFKSRAARAGSRSKPPSAGLGQFRLRRFVPLRSAEQGVQRRVAVDSGATKEGSRRRLERLPARPSQP